MSSLIKTCKYCADNNITHEFQDSKYGKFHRIVNIGAKGEKCTVCANGKSKK